MKKNNKIFFNKNSIENIQNFSQSYKLIKSN